MNPLVAILILNYNRLNDTIECVESIKKSEYNNMEIVVVDNGSTDGSEEALRERFKDVSIIQTGSNLGFSGGNNFGIKYLLALQPCPQYILLINNDTLVEPDFLLPLIKALNSDSKVAAAGGTICCYPDKEKIWYAGGRFSFWRATSISNYSGMNIKNISNVKEQKVTFLSGCFLLIRASVIKKIGLLDETFFMYFEDTELSLRIIKAGFHLLYIPQSIIYHKIGKRTNPYLSLYFTTRNRMLFINKVTTGLPRIIAISYFFTVTFIKMTFWIVWKPKYFSVAYKGLEDYYKKNFFEGRGLIISAEENNENQKKILLRINNVKNSN